MIDWECSCGTVHRYYDECIKCSDMRPGKKKANRTPEECQTDNFVACLREIERLREALEVCLSFLSAEAGAVAHLRDHCNKDCGCVLSIARAALSLGRDGGEK